VKLALDGDMDARHEIVIRYTPDVFRVAQRIAKEPDDVNDIVQETFLCTFTKLADFDGRSQFRTWITRIAINRANDVVRTRKRERYPILVRREEKWEAPDPADRIFVSEMLPHLMNGLALLTPKERAAFVCRHILEMSVREISVLLDSDDSATRNSIFRAILKLRAYLGPLVRPNHESEPSDRRAVD
jgi:RNA polymerase sigma-70 factor (ECF subfamily)